MRLSEKYDKLLQISDSWVFQQWIGHRFEQLLTFQAPIPQNSQTDSNNLSSKADELFESVWPFCGVGTYMVKIYEN